MTVKELFNSLSFAEIASLMLCDNNKYVIRGSAFYKEAFDIIRSIPEKKVDTVVTFEVFEAAMRKLKSSRAIILAYNVETPWDILANSKVEKPHANDVSISNAELAGAILWGATCYGFAKHPVWLAWPMPLPDLFTDYGERAKQLNLKLYIPYMRNKKEIRKLKKTTCTLGEGKAIIYNNWTSITLRREHQNRQKRKRYFRISNRIKLFKEIDRRTHILNEMEKAGVNIDSNLKTRLLRATDFFTTWRVSHCQEDTNRVDYLIELITKYTPDMGAICHDCNMVVIVIYSSMQKPLLKSEYDTILYTLSKASSGKNSNAIILKGVDNSLNDEIAMQIIALSPKEDSNHPHIYI